MTTVATAAATAAQQRQETSRVGLADNFETFLTLLTAQLRNQDPLSPMDSTQFTNQLVQFSGVEQQLRTNDLLTSLAENNRLSAGATAVAYLGKEATAATNRAGLAQAGGTATWTYDLARAATDVRVTVKDEAGRIVATATAPGAAGPNAFQWDGRDLAGRPAPAGAYTLEIAARDGSGGVVSSTISRRGLVTGVDLSGATPTVTLDGASVPLNAVRSIAQPQSALR